MPDDVFARSGKGEPAVAALAAGDALFRSVDDAVAAGTVSRDAVSAAAADAPAEPSRLDLVRNIPVRLSVELGRAELPIRDVLNIDRGSVIALDRNLGQPLDVRVNGVLIGHGEIVVVDEDRLGLRLVDVVSPAERVSRLA